MKNTWSLQDAKARFSELVNRAQKDGAQTVTRRGEKAVVVLPVEDYQRLLKMGQGGGLVEFFQKSPLAELPAGFLERDRDTGRDLKL